MKAVVVVAMLLAGCAARGPVYSTDKSVPSTYDLGMKEGCSSGYAAAGNPYYRFTKSPNRYLDDVMYKQGWDDGMVKCKGEYEAIGRALR